MWRNPAAHAAAMAAEAERARHPAQSGFMPTHAPNPQYIPQATQHPQPAPAVYIPYQQNYPPQQPSFMPAQAWRGMRANYEGSTPAVPTMWQGVVMPPVQVNMPMPQYFGAPYPSAAGHYTYPVKTQQFSAASQPMYGHAGGAYTANAPHYATQHHIGYAAVPQESHGYGSIRNNASYERKQLEEGIYAYSKDEYRKDSEAIIKPRRFTRDILSQVIKENEEAQEARKEGGSSAFVEENALNLSLNAAEMPVAAYPSPLQASSASKPVSPIHGADMSTPAPQVVPSDVEQQSPVALSDAQKRTPEWRQNAKPVGPDGVLPKLYDRYVPGEDDHSFRHAAVEQKMEPQAASVVPGQYPSMRQKTSKLQPYQSKWQNTIENPFAFLEEVDEGSSGVQVKSIVQREQGEQEPDIWMTETSSAEARASWADRVADEQAAKQFSEQLHEADARAADADKGAAAPVKTGRSKKEKEEEEFRSQVQEALLKAAVDKEQIYQAEGLEGRAGIVYLSGHESASPAALRAGMYEWRLSKLVQALNDAKSLGDEQIRIAKYYFDRVNEERSQNHSVKIVVDANNPGKAQLDGFDGEDPAETFTDMLDEIQNAGIKPEQGPASKASEVQKAQDSVPAPEADSVGVEKQLFDPPDLPVEKKKTTRRKRRTAKKAEADSAQAPSSAPVAEKMEAHSHAAVDHDKVVLQSQEKLDIDEQVHEDALIRAEPEQELPSKAPDLEQPLPDVRSDEMASSPIQETSLQALEDKKKRFEENYQQEKKHYQHLVDLKKALDGKDKMDDNKVNLANDYIKKEKLFYAQGYTDRGDTELRQILTQITGITHPERSADELITEVERLAHEINDMARQSKPLSAEKSSKDIDVPPQVPQAKPMAQAVASSYPKPEGFLSGLRSGFLNKPSTAAKVPPMPKEPKSAVVEKMAPEPQLKPSDRQVVQESKDVVLKNIDQYNLFFGDRTRIDLTPLKLVKTSKLKTGLQLRHEEIGTELASKVEEDITPDQVTAGHEGITQKPASDASIREVQEDAASATVLDKTEVEVVGKTPQAGRLPPIVDEITEKKPLERQENAKPLASVSASKASASRSAVKTAPPDFKELTRDIKKKIAEAQALIDRNPLPPKPAPESAAHKIYMDAQTENARNTEYKNVLSRILTMMENSRDVWSRELKEKFEKLLNLQGELIENIKKSELKYDESIVEKSIRKKEKIYAQLDKLEIKIGNINKEIKKIENDLENTTSIKS